MAITRENEALLRFQLIETTNKLIESFFILKKMILRSENKDFDQVLILDNLIKLKTLSSLNTIIINYQMAPLGKDLRRNISYTFINQSLKDIANSSLNIANFLMKSSKEGYSTKWALKMVDLIIEGLQMISILIESENSSEAKNIIEFDKKINIEFETLIIDSFADNKKENTIIIKEKIKFLKIGYIISAKNFEDIGDKLKTIAENILYIIGTANF
ncbi:MAG: hypothetical protein GQ557_00130 [Mycoplasmataceae bacterium]|nr:hypothetical protein [Mycoplasmataceae bacterium]